MSSWRSAGFSYLRYSNTCAILTRRALKEPFRAKAAERDSVNMKVEQWILGKGQDKTDVRSAANLAGNAGH